MRKLTWLLALTLLVAPMYGQSRTSGRTAPGFLNSIKNYIETIRYRSFHVDSLTVSDSTTLILASDVDLTGNYLLDTQNITDLQGIHAWFDGTDDSLLITYDANMLDVFDANGGAIEIVLRPESDGSSDTAYVWSMSGTLIGLTGESSGAMKARLIYDFSTTDGQWTTTNTCVSTNDWNHLFLGYDADATTNDPVLYVNADSVGFTEDTTPAGTRGSDASANIVIGNNGTSTGYPYDGDIALIRYWNMIPSYDEIKALYSGSPVPFKYRGGDNTILVDSSAAGNDTITVEVGKRYYWVKGNADSIAYINSEAYVSQISEATTYTFTTATYDSVCVYGTDLTGGELYQIGVVMEYLGFGLNDVENKWYSSADSGFHAAMDEALVIGEPNNLYIQSKEPVANDKIVSVNKLFDGTNTEIWVLDEDGDVVQTGDLTIGDDKSIFSSASDININPAEGGHVVISGGDTLIMADGSGADSILIYDSGTYFILESDNALAFNAANNSEMTAGITLRTDALDNEAFAIQNTDVDHGSDQADSSTYVAISKYHATAGGVQIEGFSDGDATATALLGTVTSNNPTDATPAVRIIGQKMQSDSTGVEVMGNDESVLAVQSYGTAKLSVLGEGDLIIHSGDPTESSKMVLGLNVKQGANDDEALTLQSTDIDHAVTDVADSTTYFTIRKLHATSGGALVTGFSDTDAEGLRLRGVIGTNNPTDTKAAVEIVGVKDDAGADAEAVGNDETVLDVTSGTTAHVTVLGQGDLIVHSGDGTESSLMTYGVLVKQAANDDEAFALQSTDVDHGSDQADSSTYLAVSKYHATSGGVQIEGLSDGDATAAVLLGTITSNNPTDATPAALIIGQKMQSDSTGVEVLGNDESVFAVQNYDAAKFTVLGEGDAIVHSGDPTESSLMTLGFLVKQGAADDEVLAFQSSDVDHGMDQADSSTYASFKKLSATAGGLEIESYTDGDAGSMAIVGTIGNNNPTDTNPAIKVMAQKMQSDSTGVEVLAADETVFSVENYTTKRVAFLGDGDMQFQQASEIQTTANDLTLNPNADLSISADTTFFAGVLSGDLDFDQSDHTDLNKLTVDTVVVTSAVLADAAFGANLGSATLEFNLGFFDSVHAAVYGNQAADFAAGEAGFDITFNADTLKGDVVYSGNIDFDQKELSDINYATVDTLQIGGADTFIEERAADTLEVTVGGAVMLRLEEGAADQITTAAAAFDFDGASTVSTSGNNLLTVTGGTAGVRLDDNIGVDTAPSINSTIAMGRSVTATDDYDGVDNVETVTLATTKNYAGVKVDPAGIVAHDDGTHTSIAGVNIGNFTVTETNSSTITTLAGLYIENTPQYSGAGGDVTNLYSIFVDAGESRFDADINLDGDLDFTGAQSITTTSGDLTLNPAGSNVTIPTGDTLVVDNITLNVDLLPDADDGANIGATATRINLIWADSVHAAWFGGSDFELGAAGDKITFDGDTLEFNAGLEMGMNGTYISDTEFAYLDGQDQAVGSNDSPTFVTPVASTGLNPDADQGADVGENALRFNHGYFDTLHANVYDGSDIVIGASGSDVTFNADTVKGDYVSSGVLTMGNLFNFKAGTDIASTATITLGAGNVFTVTGTADIDSIDTASPQATGAVVVLIFSGTAGVTGVIDGKNLKIAGNYGYATDYVMTLVRKSNDFYEISRSNN